MSSNTYYNWERVEMKPLIPTKYKKVLEIGCGRGRFRNNLDSQCEYWGVEPVEEIAEEAKKNLHKVFVGTYDDVAKELPDNYFDLIICNDVIEHMVDHDAFFEEIKAKMTADAYLIGSIPNVRCFTNLSQLIMKKDWRYLDAGILDTTHLRFFTEKSLKRTLSEHGYVIEKFMFLNSILNFKSSPVKSLRRKLFISLLGKDTEFIQFGFQVRK